MKQVQQIWNNAMLYNPATHTIHQWAASLSKLVQSWSQSMPTDHDRDWSTVHARNLRACSSILDSIIHQHGDRTSMDLETLRLGLERGMYRTAGHFATNFHDMVTWAYRNNHDIRAVSDIQHRFEVQWAKRVYQDGEEEEQKTMDMDTFEEGDEEDVEERIYERLVHLLELGRRLGQDLDSLAPRTVHDSDEEEEKEDVKDIGGYNSEATHSRMDSSVVMMKTGHMSDTRKGGREEGGGQRYYHLGRG